MLISYGQTLQNAKLYPLVRFENQREVDRWRIVNDGVMGGVSNSQVNWTDGEKMTFSGRVSLDNNGGFASVRCGIKEGSIPAASDGVYIKVKGDGQRYGLRLKMQQRSWAPSYAASFLAAEEPEQTWYFPFGDFIPVFRGRVLDNVEALRNKSIVELGFIISDKQEGPFKLEIGEVGYYQVP